MNALVHPHQIEVQDFGSYALIIDARSEHEYAEDHIPGAINLPVVFDAEYSEVGTKYKKDPHAAYLVGAQYAMRNIANHIATHISPYSADDRFLIYCFRGGKRSRVWENTLTAIGFKVDVLKGGWKNYRKWVRDALEWMPRQFEYRLLVGPTGCGKTRLLRALEKIGEQVLDLEALASHRGSLLGALPGQPQPSQKMFDSLLIDKLRTFDSARPVWIEGESKRVGNVQMPESLHEAMWRVAPIAVSASLHNRVQLLREDYPHLASNLELMVEKLQPLKPLLGNAELTLWRSLALSGQVDALFERVMVAHYDPCYERSRKNGHRNHTPMDRIVLPSLDESQLEWAAADLSRRFGFAGQAFAGE